MRFALVVALSLGAAFASAQTLDREGSEREVRATLENCIGRNGGVVYAALYALPETREALLRALGGHEAVNSSFCPSEFPERLSAHQKELIFSYVVHDFVAKSPDERRKLLDQIDSWVIGHDQLRVCQRLSPVDIMGALYELPLTRDCFDHIIQNRGLTHGDVTATVISETLASAERADLMFRVLTKLSTMDRRQQATYYRDLYSELVELMGSQ